MDYSLLLGIDKKQSELVVGLVDAVGSYGLFKNIESMGKMALNRGREGEVTIVRYVMSFSLIRDFDIDFIARFRQINIGNDLKMLSNHISSSVPLNK